MTTPESGKKWQLSGLLVALGIIFGDIGTSPLYVLKAVIGAETVTKPLVYGAISCIFWTFLLITTFKYVYLALKADNRGEGGIFALYARVRRYKARWVIFPALIGCAMLMSDGFLTPAISISAAVEGVHLFYPQLDTMPIVMAVLIGLFTLQQFGWQRLAQGFGYIMLVWFGLIATVGLIALSRQWSILEALNPTYALQFILHYKGETYGMTGFWLLGAVFLCTTGCEALYTDLGLCGKLNIRFTWLLLVFPCLMLNYLGQAVWVLQFEGQHLPADALNVGVFFAMIPHAIAPYVIGLAILATIIVSQALISGIFTMVNEATQLRLWFNMRVSYPTQLRGQVYIPFINWFLLAGCLLSVWIFRRSSNMEEAYGLTIVIDMVMTSSLLLHFIHMRNQQLGRAIALGLVFGVLELMFLVASFHKLSRGGWFTLSIAAFIFFCVFIFFRARKIRQKHANFCDMGATTQMIKDLIKDETVEREAANLVFMSLSPDEQQIDSNIVYSIFRKKPKRADIYWFVHVATTDAPYTEKHKVTTLVPGKIYHIKMKFGFKKEHRMHKVFKSIVDKMQTEGLIDEQSHYRSMRKYELPAEFKYVLLNSRISADDDLTPFETFVVRYYRLLKKIARPPAESLGIDLSNVVVETVPINVSRPALMADLIREN